MRVRVAGWMEGKGGGALRVWEARGCIGERNGMEKVNQVMCRTGLFAGQFMVNQFMCRDGIHALAGSKRLEFIDRRGVKSTV